MDDPTANEADSDDADAESDGFEGVADAWHIEQRGAIKSANEKHDDSRDDRPDHGGGHVADEKQRCDRDNADDTIRDEIDERRADVGAESVRDLAAVELVDVVLTRIFDRGGIVAIDDDADECRGKQDVAVEADK